MKYTVERKWQEGFISFFSISKFLNTSSETFFVQDFGGVIYRVMDKNIDSGV